MKIFLVVIHLILGAGIIFFSLNSQLTAYNKVHNTDKYYSVEDLQNTGITDHVEDLKRTETQRITGGVLVVLIGALSIFSALAFRKDKRWSRAALPMATLLMIVAMFYTRRFDEGFAAAASVLPIIILTILLAIEIGHFTLQKKSTT